MPNVRGVNGGPIRLVSPAPLIVNPAAANPQGK